MKMQKKYLSFRLGEDKKLEKELPETIDQIVVKQTMKKMVKKKPIKRSSKKFRNP